MSAFKYLVYVLGVIIVAVFGSILISFIDPLLAQASVQSSTAASAKGLSWFESFMDIFALVGIGLLTFALLVGIVNRRSRVVR